ncbi:MAG: Rieske 2Fe-2S domain-containing protein [Candidatus Rokubacteria bacterium]|nr:Rieske 2Fe-2S domain-containing protein [Candidatus Rokubacteria bacterium]
MLSAADNELLTRTGPGTPMGAFFRRFWQPAVLSREVGAPDGPPVRVRIMGEDYVAFRATDGRVGLVEPRCAHRGADLYFGRNEECGLRCAYHGWKYDAGGRCVDLPNAKPGAGLRERITIRACPTREYGEIVWAWLGPGDPPGEPPALEIGRVPPAHRFVTKKLQYSNWAQSLEGGIDTAHFSFLHMPAPSVASNANPDAPADERRLRWIREDANPEFSFVDHEVGFVIGASRRADGADLYWRIAQFMLPAHATTPSTLPGETYFGYTWVPIDDTTCWIYTYAWNPERPLGREERAKLEAGHGVIGAVDERYVPVRNRDNEYLIDREEQRRRTFTGIRGVAEQDAMIQESQGPIADRTAEHLTATDAAIVRFRRAVLAGARALADGAEPAAAKDATAYTRRSGSWVADARVPFEEVMRQRFGDRAGLVSAAPGSQGGEAR